MTINNDTHAAPNDQDAGKPVPRAPTNTLPSIADLATAVAANTAAITRLIDRQAMAENAIMQQQNRLDMGDMAAAIRELSGKFDRLTGPTPGNPAQRPATPNGSARSGARPVRASGSKPPLPVAPRPQRALPGATQQGSKPGSPSQDNETQDDDKDDGGRKWL